jgi:hypothetical protein
MAVKFDAHPVLRSWNYDRRMISDNLGRGLSAGYLQVGGAASCRRFAKTFRQAGISQRKIRRYEMGLCVFVPMWALQAAAVLCNAR